MRYKILTGRYLLASRWNNEVFEYLDCWVITGKERMMLPDGLSPTTPHVRVLYNGDKVWVPVASLYVDTGKGYVRAYKDEWLGL